jgi:hypothetical protein
LKNPADGGAEPFTTPPQHKRKNLVSDISQTDSAVRRIVRRNSTPTEDTSYESYVVPEGAAEEEEAALASSCSRRKLESTFHCSAATPAEN